jgi:hypothetical protein
MNELQQTERVIPHDTAHPQESSTLLKFVHRNLPGVQSWLSMEQSAWEEINSLFDVDGRIAKCLEHLPKSPGHNGFSVREVLAVLKFQYFWHVAQISKPDVFREAYDELRAFLD